MQGVAQFLGGVGLFLFGMGLMTTALRELAAGRLRHLLARFTETPLAGVATGAVATAVVQSSSAVTVMTIGFVGAGLVGFSQSLGVLYGANIGTTITGWVVVLVGFKLQLGLAALPLVFVASLMGLLGRGRVERAGRLLAGFALLFIGLEMMQAAMAGLDGRILPGLLAGGGWLARLQLAALGIVLTLLMQSSSAGVALALVLLGSGALGFAEAAALVVGMNVGTTFTGLLAALGGGRAMRMTALANFLFNLATAALAFPLIGLVTPLLHASPLGSDDPTALVLFHTGFNLFGTLVFLPLTGPFAALVERLVPMRRAALAEPLDLRLLADEGAAMDAVQAVADAVARTISTALADALGPRRDLRRLVVLDSRVRPALAELEAYLVQINLPAERTQARERFAALLHQIDHLTRLLARCHEGERISELADDARLTRPARLLSLVLQCDLPVARLARLTTLVDARARRPRRAAPLREPDWQVAPGELLRRTDAMRWLERVYDHIERIAHYRTAAKQKS
jgi:phosphate:Na+ symporter